MTSVHYIAPKRGGWAHPAGSFARASRDYCEALAAVGYDVWIDSECEQDRPEWRFSQTMPPEVVAAYRWAKPIAKPDVLIKSVFGIETRVFDQAALDKHLGYSHRILQTTYETMRPSDQVLEALALWDAVFVPSRWNADCLRAAGLRNVHAIPHVVTEHWLPLTHQARKPKDHAIISEIDGEVSFGKDTKGKRKVVITPYGTDGHQLPDQAREYLIPKGKHIQVQPGDRMRAGDALMDGPANPHDILRVKGEKELAAWLVNEIQQVYRLQGVGINDKHIEVIVRQMLRRVRIKEVGDTNFLVDEQVEKHLFERENARVLARSGQPAVCPKGGGRFALEAAERDRSSMSRARVVLTAAITLRTRDAFSRLDASFAIAKSGRSVGFYGQIMATQGPFAYCPE